MLKLRTRERPHPRRNRAVHMSKRVIRAQMLEWKLKVGNLRDNTTRADAQIVRAALIGG